MATVADGGLIPLGAAVAALCAFFYGVAVAACVMSRFTFFYTSGNACMGIIITVAAFITGLFQDPSTAHIVQIFTCKDDIVNAGFVADFTIFFWAGYNAISLYVASCGAVFRARDAISLYVALSRAFLRARDAFAIDVTMFRAFFGAKCAV